MFDFSKKKKASENAIVAPTDGTMISIETVNDPVFATKMLGDGVAFVIKGSTIVAPCSGTLSMVYPTGHAFGITRKDGLELLVHIGIETVNLDGAGFTLLKKQGEKVKAGQPVVSIDDERIRQLGYDTTTMLIVTNSNQKTIEFLPPQTVSAGQIIA